MKTQTEQRYLSRVDRAARLLAERLDDPLDADALARAVGVSRFHFQRIYRAATGETLLETLVRLRASRALELLASGVSVTEVAGAVGYETPQAFARAFRQWTGMSPSAGRGQAERLLANFRRPLPPEPKPVQVEITSIAPLRLTVVRTRRPFGPLNDVYEGLFEAIAMQERLEEVVGIYGIPENDPLSDPQAMEHHIAGVCLGAATLDGYETMNVDAATALRLRHTGAFEQIDAASVDLYRYVIEHDLALQDVPPLHHHLDDPEEVPEARLRTDLYLKLADRPDGDHR